jgi:hypothetical protein
MIPWLAIKLFAGGLLKRLWEAATALLGLIRRYPLQMALIAALCLAGWQWRGKQQALDKLARCETESAAKDAASKANAAAQLEQKRAWEAKSTALAKDADNAYTQGMADARTATDRYIAANRVRPPANRLSAPRASGQGNDPAIPESLPADTGLVGVSESDLQACAGAVTYSIAAHNNAVDKIVAGLAE